MNKSNIPCTVKFSESTDHNNLMKVKLVVMHEGENRNGSAFSMQAIESARETLKNVPILGYILRSDDGEALDFDEHNMSIQLSKGDNGYELKEFYEEQVIGIIPETNEYHYEMIDGVNHVCCVGYIFKSYSNGGADLVASCENKGVSMEIAIGAGNSINDVYHIDKYQYHAVTILGDHVSQGMNGTCHVKKFSLEDDCGKQIIESMCEEIQKTSKGKEETFMDEETTNVEFEEKRKIDDTVVEETKPPVESDTQIDPEGVKVDEQVAEENVAEEPTETHSEEEVVEDAQDADESDDEFACGGGKKKKKKFEDDETEEEKEEKFSLDCFSVFFEEVPNTLAEVCDALLNKFNSLNAEIEDLKAFKNGVETEVLKAEVDAITEEFDFADEEISEVKEKAYNGDISVAEFKKELFVLEGMKAHANKEKFSKVEKTVKPKVAVVEKARVNNEPYGGLFDKYLK